MASTAAQISDVPVTGSRACGTPSGVVAAEPRALSTTRVPASSAAPPAPSLPRAVCLEGPSKTRSARVGMRQRVPFEQRLQAPQPFVAFLGAVRGLPRGRLERTNEIFES